MNLALQEEARAVQLPQAAGACLYFSMLSPDEWGGKPPHPYEGSYRLENDQSFTRVDT